MRPLLITLLVCLSANAWSTEHRLDFDYLSLPLPENRDQLSLNGSWRFHLLPEGSERDERMAAPAFDDSDWGLIAVPSNWEMQGYESPRYRRPSATSAWYRSRFILPQAWSGDRLVLRFDGVLYALTVWINGQKVGEWSSAYQPVQFDISSFVHRGHANHIAVHVSKQPPAYEFDCNDAWALSGIYRDVTLYRLPRDHFAHLQTETRLLDDRSATLSVDYGVQGAADEVQASLYDPTGRLVAKQTVVPTESLIFNIEDPLLWSAEIPNLYSLVLTLNHQGQEQHRIEQPVGIRQVSIDGKVLRLNGKAIKLRGTCRHEIHPEVGRALREEHWGRDLELMKQAHINMIRTSHYPPHPRLLELCDQLGMYVICEVPFGFGDQHLTDPAFQGELLTRAEATVRRDQNHPSVIIWSVGNENPYTPLVEETVLKVKALDDSRPVCIPQSNKDFIKEGFELPDFVDILALHYPVPEQLRSFVARTRRPMILTEYSHSLGLASEGAQTLWQMITEHSALAGGALWVWSDQGIRRRDTENPYPQDSPQAVWLDRNTVLDSDGQSGTDGQVYANRLPHVDYWQIRHIYSPVQIQERQIDIQGGQETVSLTLINRYDFLSLESHVLDYTVMRDNRMLTKDTMGLDPAAGATQAIECPVELPDPLGNHEYRLDLRILDGNRQSIHNVSIELVHERDLVARLRESGSVTPRVTIETEGFKVVQGDIRIRINRQSARITIKGPGGTVLFDSVPLLHVSRKPTMAEKRIKRKKWDGDFYWQPPNLEPETVSACEIDTSAAAPTCRMQLRYVRPDSNQLIDMELELRF